jgi:hypothetical protein
MLRPRVERGDVPGCPRDVASKAACAAGFNRNLGERTMRLGKFVVTAACALLPVVGIAAEQAAGGGAGGGERPCAADLQRLCADAMQGGREAINACLVKNKDQLSDACKARIEQAAQAGGGGGQPAQ